MSRRNEFKASLSYCAETCPDVERAISDAWEAIKPMIAQALQDDAERVLDGLFAEIKRVGTERLRDALCEALSDKSDAEGERDDLKREVESLEEEVDFVRAQVATLERELEGANA